MRFYFATFCVVLILGCRGSRDDAGVIARSLEKRITREEARHMVLDELDTLMRDAKGRVAAQGNTAEQEIVTGMRTDFSAELEAFLSHLGSGDELWLYRTPGKAKHRGAETGFARLSGGKVVEHMMVRVEP
jgi:hypothetical protein